MAKPRLLDLFCGVGGCSVGYDEAGFEVVGVDWERQKDYPFGFHQADAMTYPFDGFDVIHASPPCQRFTVANQGRRVGPPHPDLLTPMLARLRSSGKVWVVENVPQAPMPSDSVVLCGSAFGLRVRRHRKFGASVPLVGSGCKHKEQGRAVGVYGNGGAWVRGPGGGGVKVVREEAAAALGIGWSTVQRSLAQAIPPAYTHFVGGQLISHV